MAPEQRAAWAAACEFAEKQYFAMLAAGAAPQIARAVLPTCLRTELVMTANMREWRHFLRLRLGEGAHPQIKEIARLVAARLHEAVPVLFDEFV